MIFNTFPFFSGRFRCHLSLFSRSTAIAARRGIRSSIAKETFHYWLSHPGNEMAKIHPARRGKLDIRARKRHIFLRVALPQSCDISSFIKPPCVIVDCSAHRVPWSLNLLLPCSPASTGDRFLSPFFYSNERNLARSRWFFSPVVNTSRSKTRGFRVWPIQDPEPL